MTERRSESNAGGVDIAGGLKVDLDQPIYTLGVASEMLETHPRTLMVYEQLNMVTPLRTATNRRRYSPRDLLKLQAIQHITRDLGVNLAGTRLILSLLKRFDTSAVKVPAQYGDLHLASLDV